MKKWHKVTIPKPCHEDWNKMTPNNKGKFCDVCTKTVIDFTNKSSVEIQNILFENKGKRVCGHFYKSQLETINIEIPNYIFKKQYSQVRIFALALLLAMGTTLMSCKTDGKVKKIESVDIVEFTEPFSGKDKVDSKVGDTIQKTEKFKKVKTSIINKPVPSPILDSIKKPEPIDLIFGDVIIETVEGEMVFIPDENQPIHFQVVEVLPEFKNTKDSSKQSFNKQMNKFVKDNFDLDISPDYNFPKGKNRISVQFIIDEKGNVKDIKVRASHKILEKTTLEMFKKLPQFIPAKQNGKTVDVKYNLPINFNVE